MRHRVGGAPRRPRISVQQREVRACFLTASGFDDMAFAAAMRLLLFCQDARGTGTRHYEEDGRFRCER